MSAVAKIPPLAVVVDNDPVVDPKQLGRFVESVFRHARPGEGYLALRNFPNKEGGGAAHLDWVKFGESDQLACIVRLAQDAASYPAGADGRIFSPPVALFRAGGAEKWTAGKFDVSFSPTITVDLDADPVVGLAKLEAVIGPASLVVESGGLWNGVPKVHAYWILREPARDWLRRAEVKLARRYARVLAGGDKAAERLELPMRWPGGVHTKKEPKRSVRIITDRPEVEIDLREATDQLAAALAAAGIEVGGELLEPTANRKGFRTKTPLDERTLAILARHIPNPDLVWDDYRTVQMAFYDATHGNVEGLEALHDWASKSEKYDLDEVDGSWAHFRYSPPSLVWSGTLLKYLRKANPQAWAAVYANVWYEPLADPVTPLKPSKAPAIGFITEARVAHSFVSTYADRIRYAHDVGHWYVWNGVRFQQANKGLVAHWAARYAFEAVSFAEKAEVKKATEKSNFVKGVLTLAKDDPRVAVDVAEWDRDHFLAGTPEGTLDLKTGTLRDAQLADGVTRQLGTSPSFDAWCPRWRQFLGEATGSDQETIRFLQQFAGYSLTGSTKEHALLFLFGGGGNGKGVFLNVVSRILGDYAMTASMDTFIDNRFEGHSTGLAMLNGARLVTASETQQGRAWNESRIKSVTGGDKITARFMRADNFTFAPAFKLVVAGNHKPVLRNVDDAARRRFAMVPFNRKPTKVDRDLEEKLWEEAPGILRWMIDGCLDWQRNGLVRSAAVLRENERYFESQDVFSQWAEDTIEAGGDSWTKSADLYGSWNRFAKSSNEDPGTMRAFADRLTARGFEPQRRNPGRGFKGVRFKAEAPPDHDA